MKDETIVAVTYRRFGFSLALRSIDEVSVGSYYRFLIRKIGEGERSIEFDVTQ